MDVSAITAVRSITTFGARHRQTRHRQTGDSTFVGTLMGKDYGPKEAGDVRFQEALDDLRNHLIYLRDAR
jgi:hypothetical protein